MTDLDKLVSEFAAEFESGAKPDPGKFLARADAQERAQLADRLDDYLDTAPPKAWDPGAYERSPARAAAQRVFESIEGEAGSWPELLPALRKRARIAREDLTRRLAESLGFPGEAARVHAYYHQMEHGQIPAANVSDRVLEQLAGIVGTSREKLREAGERVSGADLASGAGFARKAYPDTSYGTEDLRAAASPGMPTRSSRRSQPERDELDELFLGPG